MTKKKKCVITYNKDNEINSMKKHVMFEHADAWM